MAWLLLASASSLDEIVSGKLPLICELVALLGCYALYRYWSISRKYHQGQANVGKGELPPQYPHLIPFLGSFYAFVFDNFNFMSRATQYNGSLTSVRMVFFGHEVYLFQDRGTIQKIWRTGKFSSPISMYQYVFKYFFGASETQISTYREDDSGPLPKPHKDSKVAAENRIDHITLSSFHRAFSGPGLLPTTRRFMQILERRIGELKIISEDEWTEIPDMLDFFHDIVGSSLIESIWGPTLLRLNPGLVDDMWEFDEAVPYLARGVPAFWKPRPYQIREKIVTSFRRWYAYARANFVESSIAEDGDGDPYWGSYLIRYRQKVLPTVKNHDDDMLARTDLGLVWGAIGNTIPCCMMATIEILKDQELLGRVRDIVAKSFTDRGISLVEADTRKLSSDPLLSSIYAETLRLYVKTYFLVSSPHEPVSLGRWSIPKGKIGLMNAGLSHMDENFWNTRNGARPVNSFWAERFLVYPSDPLSGPINPDLPEARTSRIREGKPTAPRPEEDENAPFFTMEGVDGSWFPYGGGYGICPGRFLAKNAILFTSGYLASKFDIELLIDRIETTPWRFGMGVAKPEHSIPFRIKKRKVDPSA